MGTKTAKKPKMLDRVADETGVAIVVLNDKSHEVSVSNNNSICRTMTNSSEFAPRCAEFCGVAFRNTAEGQNFEYECYAGLSCNAIPVTDRGKRFVAIVGRAFTSSEKYRKATERSISGDWAQFSTNQLFENVVIASSASDIEKATERLAKFRAAPENDLLDLDAPPVATRPTRTTETPSEKEVASPEPIAAAEAIGTLILPAETPELISESPEDRITKLIERFNASVSVGETLINVPGEMNRRMNEASSLRTLHGRLSKLSYTEACIAALEFLSVRTGFGSLVWLERKDNRMFAVTSTGALRETPIKIGIAADNRRLVEAANSERPLELRERVFGDERPGRTLNLFASVVSGDIRGAIGVEGSIEENKARDVALFARRIGPQIEILRLRREVSDREWINRAVARFNESLKRIDAEDFWTHVTQVSAELIQSERASLLLRDEQSDDFLAKATLGSRINISAEPGIGERVARLVLEDGNPVVVEDITRIGIKAAPDDWRYKTHSFLSYPILIGDRRIGVMNFTDKVTGDAFGARDLELLQAIAPQIAVAVDRTVLKEKAGEFEQLSVTDALTGLLNRRYLEKRLSEEIQRSKRHRFPMSLMMLDVDNFKSYNDTFGHLAGDVALKIVANALQDMLRGADVAARYGGEEFAILLPQTTANEAAVIGERLRQRIEYTEFPKRKVTVSIGIASISNEIETPADVIGAADHALYEAKNQGRNNVRIYDGFGKFTEKIH